LSLQGLRRLFSDPATFAGTLKTGTDEITKRLLHGLGH
jgi:hypothetical protein